MKRKTLLFGFAAILVLLAASSEVKAWYAYHYNSYRGGGYHYGGYGYGGYHYSGYRYGGYPYSGYHSVGAGGYHYGYSRRW